MVHGSITFVSVRSVQQSGRKQKNWKHHEKLSVTAGSGSSAGVVNLRKRKKGNARDKKMFTKIIWIISA